MVKKIHDKNKALAYLEQERAKLDENGIKLIMGFDKDKNGKMCNPAPVVMTKHEMFNLSYASFVQLLQDCMIFIETINKSKGDVDKLLRLKGKVYNFDEDDEDASDINDDDDFVSGKLES